MDEKPKKTLADTIDDSEAIAHALYILSNHSSEYRKGGLFRDQVDFWEAIEPLIEAYRSFNHEAIIHALSRRLPANSKKTNLKELIIKIIRNPGLFGLEEIKKSDVEYILEKLYPDELAVFPTSSGQKNTWWEEIGLPIRQRRERENPAFVKRVAEIKANNKGGIPNYKAYELRNVQAKLRLLRAWGEDLNQKRPSEDWDEVERLLGIESTKPRPEDRGLNYLELVTGKTLDEIRHLYANSSDHDVSS